MSRSYFRTLSKAVNHYTERGYTYPFRFSDKSLSPASWVIVETHRFEGFSDPSDNVILYVLENTNGADKGIIVDIYGARSDERINHFLHLVPMRFQV